MHLMRRVIAAAKTANADYFIRHLSEGYDTVLEGDGSLISVRVPEAAS